jgi:hypothetical protein
MACHIAHDRQANLALLYCSTTDWAFGPVFLDTDDHDAAERAEAFLRWLQETDAWPRFEKEPLQTGGRDPRLLTESGLQAAYTAWRAQEADQWARQERALFAEES